MFLAVFGACGAEGADFEGGVDGPVLRHVGGFSGDGEDAQVGGAVQIEGDCLYLSFDDEQERYPVVWPASTAWDEDDGRVLLPNGDMVGQGDAVDGGGGYHDVDDVQRIAGQTAADLAAVCLDNRYGEIAVINNQRDGVRQVERFEAGDQTADGEEQGGQVVDSPVPTGKWIVDQLIVDGERVSLDPARPITLTVEGEVISGESACNRYVGAIDWSAEGGFGRFLVSEIGLTKMRCEDPVMDIERAFIDAVQSVDSYEAADGLYVGKSGAATNFHLVRSNPAD